MPRRTNIVDRFWSKVDVRGADECWEWQGSRIKGGYGNFRLSAADGMLKAHRMSALLAFGPFDRRLFVLHLCDNPPCVNPSHLALGDHAENMRQRAERGRSYNPNPPSDLCKRSHPLTGANAYVGRDGRKRCRVCIQLRERARRRRAAS